MPVLSNLEALSALTAAGDRERPGLLALDVSKTAIGIAGADASWRLATPLTTIRRTVWAKDLARLGAIVAERGAAALVIGWPLNMDGSEGRRCQAVGAFVANLERSLGLPMVLWDERLSTFAAEEAADQAGLHGRARAAALDALAAAAILQDALDTRTRSGPAAPPGDQPTDFK